MEIVERFAYLLAGLLFLIGLRLMARPESAGRGNRVMAVGVALAVVAMLAQTAILTLPEILGGLVAGSMIGLLWARQVKPTETPETIAILNGLGGMASLLIGLSDYWSRQMERNLLPEGMPLLADGLAILAGGIAFSGSLTAWARQTGRLNNTAKPRPGLRTVSLMLLAIGLCLCGLMVPYPEYYSSVLILAGVALGLGVVAAIPIAKADGLIWIALLTACGGVAVSSVGFLAQQEVVVVAGGIVLTIGLVLAGRLCRERGRSLWKMLEGGN